MLFFSQFQGLIKSKPPKIFEKFQTGNSIAHWTSFLFCMAVFFMQYKGREKAAKVVEFVAKWLNLCLSKVYQQIFFKTVTVPKQDR